MSDDDDFFNFVDLSKKTHYPDSWWKSLENRTLTQEEVLERFRLVHGDRFDYSKVEYQSQETRVTIICREHGEFQQYPFYHWQGRVGCKTCLSNVQWNLSFESLTEYVELHKSPPPVTYKDVSRDNLGTGRWASNQRVSYRKGELSDERVQRLEGIEGWHWEKKSLNQFLSPTGSQSGRISSEEWIERFRLVHGDRYDYSKFDLENRVGICKEHGEFKVNLKGHSKGKFSCRGCANAQISKTLMGHSVSEETRKKQSEKKLENKIRASSVRKSFK